MEQDLTLQALSARIGFAPQHISEVELAKATATEAFVAAVDQALNAGGQLMALLPAVRLEQIVERENRAIRRRSVATVPDDVKRRAFIGLGLAVVVLGPEAAARASADDWERIAHAWGYEITTAPDRSALLPGLLTDLKRLHKNGGPQRAITQLSSHVAMIAVSAGEAERARRWFRRAQVAANASGDTHLQAGVMGLHAVEGVFGLHSPGRVLALANKALAITDAPCIGRQRALSARTRALALQGRRRETRNALAALEEGFEQLPRDITREKISVNGWAEETLHNVTSFASAFAGIDGGDAARDEALRLYSTALWRGPTQVKLHRAIVETDAHMALDALAPLTDAQRKDKLVRLVGLKALESCEARKLAGTTELREALA